MTKRLLLIAAVIVCLGSSASAKEAIGLPWAQHKVQLDPFRKVAAGEPAPAPAPAPAQAVRCQRDEDCGGENICEAGACKPIQIRTNILYLYYRDGAFREVLLLYWARKSNPGYTVLAPVYWHFWSPSSETNIFAPFYWHFEDRIQRSTVTWVTLAVYTHDQRGSGFGLMPIFYASANGNWAVPILGTFAFHDPETHKSSGAAAFLYWWRRSPGGATDLAFPLFFSTRNATSAFTFALPLNFYWRHDDRKSLLAVPLFFWNSHASGSWFISWLGYGHREGSAHSGSVAWLYWWGGDEQEASGYHVLFPLLWDFAGRKDRTTVLFPLFWRFRGPNSNVTVAANFVHVRQGTSWFNTLFPVYWGWGDDKTGRATRLVVPLFYWQRSDNDSHTTFATLLGGYSRDAAAHTQTWLILPLLSWWRTDRGGERRLLTPLYYSHADTDQGAMTHLIGLLFYRRSDGEGSTTTLFPLFWHFWDAQSGATATALFPLYEHRSGPRDDTTIVGPVYWRRFKAAAVSATQPGSDNYVGWSAGLLPIAYFGQNAGRSHAVVFPLFWRFASARASTTVAVPLFYWHSSPRGYDGGILPVLFFWGRNGDRRYAVQFPLFFQVADARTRTSTTVTPLGFVQRDPDGTSVAIGPILPIIYARSGTQRSHLVVFPLFWHFTDRAADRSTTVVGPYWHRRWGGETTDALFPLLHYRRGTRPGGTDETSFTLFPLVHYRRDASSRVLVTPLGGSVHTPQRTAGFVGPYFWYEDANLKASLIPVLHTDVQRKSDGQHLTQWGPWFRITGPGEASAHGLFPIYGHYSDAHEHDTWAFPSYFRLRRSNGDGVDTLLPLFWRSSFDGRVTTVVGPFFARTTPTHHAVGLVPLFVHDASTRRSLTIVPPFLFFHTRDNDGSAERTSCLLIFYNHRAGEDHTTALFPLYWSTGDRDHQRAVLFPIFWHFADRATDSSWTLAGPLFWSHAGTRHTRGLLPLAWLTSDPTRGDHAQALMPIFYHRAGPDLSSFYTLLAGHHRNGPSSFWYVGPVLHTNSVTSSFTMVAPLWFSHTNKTTETTTTVIPPLLHVSRGNPESGLSSTLGLIWHRRDIASSSWAVLPLYYDVHEYRLSRFTMLLPLYGRFSDEVTHESTAIAPLFYRHATPTTISMVGFPLVWDFKRGQDRTTIVFPFYARWQRQDHVGTYVFPLYYARMGLAPDGKPDGTWRRFVFPFYDSGVRRPGDFMWEVLGGLFGHERIGRHNYVRLFYFTVETSPAQPQQAAWYGKAAEPRRKSVPRGLNVAGW